MNAPVARASSTVHDTPHVGTHISIKYRIYKILEFDRINSFHLHGNMFEYYPAGTGTNPREATKTNVVELGQGDRWIMEFNYKKPWSIHVSCTRDRIYRVRMDGIL